MRQTQTLDLRLALFGEAPTAAKLEASARPGWLRRLRAAGVLLGTWALMPVMFFVPPHAEWLVALFFGGLYFARREWTAEYIAHDFSGACPRCAEPLRIRAGAALKLPFDLSCRSCRRTASLESGRPEDAARGATTVHGADGAAPADLDVAALQAYWRNRNRTSVWSPASSDWNGWDRKRKDPVG